LSVEPDAFALAAGETADLRALLDLPARPTPIDVFFVLDTSTSMGGVIDGLVASVEQAAADLAGRELDVHVGAAEFNDRANFVPYRRLVNIGPFDCKLGRALDAIELQGGAETHLLALHNAVTGAGGHRVNPGKQADFRPGSLRLVVHATDDTIDDREDEPTPDQVAEAFRSAGVLHVGLNALATAGLTPDAGTSLDVHDVLADLSRRTGALAPPGGLDCDGNGVDDVAEGEPVTCDIGDLLLTGVGAGIGDVVVQVISALRATTTVELAATAPSFVQVALDQPTVDADLAEPNNLPFTGTVTCNGDTTGQAGDLTFVATIAGTEVTSVVAPITCGSPPVEDDPAPQSAPPAAEPAPNPSPEPAPSPNPTPEANPAPAPAPAPPIPIAISAPAPAPASAPAPAPVPAPAAASAPAAAPAPGAAPAPAAAAAPAPATSPGGATGLAVGRQSEERSSAAQAFVGDETHHFVAAPVGRSADPTAIVRLVGAIGLLATAGALRARRPAPRLRLRRNG